MNYFDTVDGILADERGWVMFPVEDPELLDGHIKNIHLASINPRQIRGNHYHQHKIEFIYIFGGKVEVVIRDVEADQVVTHDYVDCYKPMLLVARPNISHAIKNISDKPVYLLDYGTEGYDPKNPDVIVDILIKE